MYLRIRTHCNSQIHKQSVSWPFFSKSRKKENGKEERTYKTPGETASHQGHSDKEYHPCTPSSGTFMCPWVGREGRGKMGFVEERGYDESNCCFPVSCGIFKQVKMGWGHRGGEMRRWEDRDVRVVQMAGIQSTNAMWTGTTS